MENARGAEGQRTSKEVCPNCGKRAGLPISYGMPTEPGEENYYYVGYCAILPPQVNMGCTKCGHKWHSPAVGQPSR